MFQTCLRPHYNTETAPLKGVNDVSLLLNLDSKLSVLVMFDLSAASDIVTCSRIMRSCWPLWFTSHLC